MSQTIQEVIDAILRAVPATPAEGTVDTVKAGDPAREVTGVVTTFLASQAVVQRAVELGANLIITHEPIYYNHHDETDWLARDAVYAAKRRLIEESGVVIWRFHDYWHQHAPDGVLTGLLKALDWEQYVDAAMPAICNIPPATLGELARALKARLGVHTMRVVGDLAQECRRVGILVGAWGGAMQIGFLGRESVDALICGEIAEWETCEYVRDAVTQGRRLGLIVLGHANSEEPGMAWLAEWLRALLPDTPVHHVPLGDPFHFV